MIGLGILWGHVITKVRSFILPIGTFTNNSFSFSFALGHRACENQEVYANLR